MAREFKRFTEERNMNNIPGHLLKKIQEAKKKQLKELDLSCDWGTPNAQMLTIIPAEVFALEQLEVLKVINNRLTAIPDTIAQLHNLTSLNLSSNQLTEVLDTIGQLHDLMSLNLSSNKLTKVSDMIGQLQNLTSLNLSSNQLTEVPDTIGQLQNLTSLNLSSNRLTEVPDTIGQLQNLTQLFLYDNPIQSIPELIYELRSLIMLYLSNIRFGKNQIKKISPKILQLQNLTYLDLKGNPVEIPPPEVVNKGVEAIKNYFRQLEAKGQDYLYEAKLLIIGEGGAGKTTLAKKIENPNYQLQEDETSTEGIDVIQWHFPMENGQPFRVNIWDFGGQEIYHATHQFFLTKRSLYALVADTRKEDTDFYYWLNAVELLSDNSPLVIIKNEKQDRHREINERLLRGQFTNLKETLPTNLATNRGLSEILQEIKHYICQLPHIGAPLPKTWVKVREALEKDSRNHISLEEYLDVCEKNDFTERKDSLQLSGYLHDLGVCLHFQEDSLLKMTVILKPKWAQTRFIKFWIIKP